MSYADAAAAVSGKGLATHELCSANGCPLAGVRTTSTSGSDKWLCRVHFGIPHGEHDGVTVRVNNRVVLYHIAARLSNIAPIGEVPPEVHERIRALGRKEFLSNTPEGPLSAYGLASLMFAVLDGECRMPQAHMGTPAQEAGAPNWLDEQETVLCQ